MNEMAFHQLEDRVARLEEELRKIQTQLGEQSRRSFDAMAGSYGDRKTLEAVAREGRRIRRAERESARAKDKEKGERRCMKSPFAN